MRRVWPSNHRPTSDEITFAKRVGTKVPKIVGRTYMDYDACWLLTFSSKFAGAFFTIYHTRFALVPIYRQGQAVYSNQTARLDSCLKSRSNDNSNYYIVLLCISGFFGL
jgi:hypothetical protein